MGVRARLPLVPVLQAKIVHGFDESGYLARDGAVCIAGRAAG